jgi:hypothetical protein
VAVFSPAGAIIFLQKHQFFRNFSSGEAYFWYKNGIDEKIFLQKIESEKR